MKQKTLALLLVTVSSFASPLIEMAATGQIKEWSAFSVTDLALSIVLLFWWYHLDKAEHGYAAGRLMNAGIVAAAAIAFPIYFVRTRGWRRGSLAIVLAAAFYGLNLLVAQAGEWLGGRFGA